jgi:hypothetical protein
MDEALAFVGETGPYIQNAVVRASNIFTKMEAEGHGVDALLKRAAALDLGPLLEGEEGDEAWSLLVLMARSEEIADQAVRAEEVALLAKHTFAVAQAFHSYYQKPKYSLPTPRTTTSGPGPCRWTLPAPDEGALTSSASRSERMRGRCRHRSRRLAGQLPLPGWQDYVRSAEKAGGLSSSAPADQDASDLG